MQEWQSKIFLNYIVLYLIQVQKFEHVSTCLGWAKIIKHFVRLLRFYWTILSVINSVCFQMRKRESSGYVLNCTSTQHEKSKVFWKFWKFYFQSSSDSPDALFHYCLDHINENYNRLSETYHSNAVDNLANHNDLKSCAWASNALFQLSY